MEVEQLESVVLGLASGGAITSIALELDHVDEVVCEEHRVDSTAATRDLVLEDKVPVGAARGVDEDCRVGAQPADALVPRGDLVVLGSA
jgi:hypothetical protein